MAMRVRRVLVSAFAAMSTVAGLGITPAHAADPMGALRSEITKALLGSTSHAMGYYVTVSGIPGAAQLNANTPFIPASNQKIYTALADLLQLTPTRQLITT